MDRFKLMRDVKLSVSSRKLRDSTYSSALTFDSLMEKALEKVRFGGRVGTVEVCSYDPKEPHKNEEVALKRKYPAHPVLFHLMGKLSAGSDSVVISEEDTLEFVCALH